MASVNVPMTANQAHIVRMLVETMAPERMLLEAVTVEDAWALHAAVTHALHAGQPRAPWWRRRIHWTSQLQSQQREEPMATDTRIYVMQPRALIPRSANEAPAVSALPTRYVRAASQAQAAAFIAADLYLPARVITDDDIETASREGRQIKVESAKP
jgi:alkylated DNA repair dioxygenase AlkB